jgi:acetolactate synthase-1/2/3 large subunit
VNHRVTGCHAIICHLRPFFAEAERVAANRSFPAREEWVAEVRKLKAAWPDTKELPYIKGINPNDLMHRIGATSPDAAAFVVDVGQHQMWAAQSLDMRAGQRFLTSGGMGAMGFGLPCAIGAAFAVGDRPVVMIAGDGSMQLNVQELQTVFRNKLAIKMIVMNNACHGMVRQFQQSYFGERYQSTYWGYSAPSFHRIAQAYGVPSAVVSDLAEVDAALACAWQSPRSPFLLEVKVDPMANAYPKLAFGRPITEMEPLASPLDMDAT